MSGRHENPALKQFYDRLAAAGKAANVSLTAVMRKLIVLANTLAREDRRWDADNACQPIARPNTSSVNGPIDTYPVGTFLHQGNAPAGRTQGDNSAHQGIRNPCSAGNRDIAKVGVIPAEAWLSLSDSLETTLSPAPLAAGA
jgi:hypothetical protein